MSLPDLRFVMRKIPVPSVSGAYTISKILQYFDVIDYKWVDIENIPVVQDEDKNETSSS